ncbi:MAG: ATP-binding cassette domain-containing protein [Proteobacteria bacterium]|jgi:phospholipid/cholesterol/gamma-HCH transport system ATP-binding protein|nr:ATP-binding cassette domain-containing protein [Pseudomonadota bacterium]
MIGLVDIQRTFDGEKALDGLSLRVPEGVLFGVMGPGGCGKSTLCRVICGLVRPESGVAIVDGVDLMRSGRREIAAVQRRCGVQFQNDALFEHMTVLENVEYPLRRLTSLGNVEIRARAEERLGMVGLDGYEDRLPNRLSGGQRRRVALARACVNDPRLLVCDDPTAGLDPVTSRKILEMILGIRFQTQNTVIVVSSDVVGLMSVCDDAALVWDGRVIAQGRPQAFAANPAPEVRRFLADARLPFGSAPWE